LNIKLYISTLLLTLLIGNISLANNDSLYFSNIVDSIRFYRKTDQVKSQHFIKEGLQSAKKNKRWESVFIFWKGVLHEINGNFDSAFYWLNMATENASIHKNHYMVAKSYFEKAFCFQKSGDYLNAIEEMNKSIPYFQMVKDTAYESYAYLNLGIYTYQIGEYDKSIASYYAALKLLKLLKDEETIATTMINLAEVYRLNKNYNESLKIIFSALNKHIDKVSHANAYNNLGLIYYEQQQFDSSLFYHFQSLKIRKELNHLFYISQSYNNIANSYDDINLVDSALFYYDLSLKLRKEMNDIDGITSTLGNIGILYLKNNQPKKALNYLLESSKMADSIKVSYLQIDINQSLSKAYEQLNDYKNAYFYYKKYSDHKDFAFNESKSKEIGKLEATYEIEKKQAEGERLKQEQERILLAEKERRDNMQYSIIFLGILIVFGAVLGSGKFNISPKFAEGLIFFAFLIFFEFCLVLLDPVVDDWSRGEPVYKLLFNAILAGAIFPLHAFFENLLKKRIISSAKY
jgi:tetratricopeptide (TPR) repeat protein